MTLVDLVKKRAAMAPIVSVVVIRSRQMFMSVRIVAPHPMETVGITSVVVA